MSFTVTLVQWSLLWEDPEANREKVDSLLEDVGREDLILLPEMFTTGFSMQPKTLAEPWQGSTVDWMVYLAQKRDAMIMGSLMVENLGSYYNRLVIADPDGNVDFVDKRHLFQMAGEDEVYTAGQHKKMVEFRDWRISPMVCYDLRFPVWSRNRWDSTGNADYDLLVYVANWPMARAEHWRTLLKARAIENQAYVAGVNRVGEDANGYQYRGDSTMIDFMGEPLDENAFDEIAFQVTLEKTPLQEWREKFPVWKDADDFDLI